MTTRARNPFVLLISLAAAAIGLRRLAARSNTQVHRINQK